MVSRSLDNSKPATSEFENGFENNNVSINSQEEGGTRTLALPSYLEVPVTAKWPGHMSDQAHIHCLRNKTREHQAPRVLF